MVMVIADQFTKFTIMKPTTKTINDRQTTQILIEEVIVKFGTPKNLTTDRGPQFTSEMMKCICESLGIHQAMSMPHHPQTDGQMERVNQEMEQMLCIYKERNPTEWVTWIPIIQQAYCHGFTLTTPLHKHLRLTK
jgi:transposase InsO family protein